MAHIPVEKKSGMALWPWLLGLLLLGLAGWLLLEAFDGPDEELVTDGVYQESIEPRETTDLYDGTDEGGSTAGAMAGQGLITSLDALLDADDPATLEGRNVRLSGVTASTVSGDSTFWLYNPDEGVERRIFGVLYKLGESEYGARGTDGMYNVDAGETMQVEGVVQAVEPSDPDTWGVTGEVERELRAEEVYIRIKSVENLDS